MKTSHLPGPDSLLLFDASALIHALAGTSSLCRGWVEGCASGAWRGILVAPVLAEISHRMMVLEARRRGLLEGSNPAKKLSGAPAKVRALAQTRKHCRDLMEAGMRYEAPRWDDFIQAFSLQEQAGLLTNDSLIAAMAFRLRATHLVSTDQAFKKVPGLSVLIPRDL